MAGNAARRPHWCGGGLALGLMVLGLAACGTPQPAAETSSSAQPAVTAADAAPGRESPPAATAPAASGGGLKLPAPATPEVALAEPTRALPDPERLTGMKGEEVKALLGTPGFVRRDPPAEIWQYATATCVLDLFLYTEGERAPHRVSHFEFRGRSIEGVVPADCYRQLLAAHARSPAG